MVVAVEAKREDFEQGANQCLHFTFAVGSKAAMARRTIAPDVALEVISDVY
jgi:hypothetical protein